MEAAGAIDWGALERELRAAVAADEQYERENSAKLRAVRQRLAGYEEFRDIVLASHLKPLERKDKAAKKGNVLWNPCATRAKREESGSVEIAQELYQLPGSSAEFYRDWRRCLKNGKEKYQFLLKLEGKALGRIFQADLGFGLLGEFLTVLAENVCREDRAAVVQILQGFSSTRRFGLNVALLSETEKESGRDLFRKLQSMSTSDGSSAQPSGPADHEAGGEAQLPSSSLLKEAEGEIVMELMKRYQVG
ncbi:CC103 protein, partial [Crypturellus undulatus]|nr:CC103 protein [Crypturellus undulatus]